MFSWKDYYVERERRFIQLDEARHYRLEKSCSVVKTIRSINFQVSRPIDKYTYAKETK